MYFPTPFISAHYAVINDPFHTTKIDSTIEQRDGSRVKSNSPYQRERVVQEKSYVQRGTDTTLTDQALLLIALICLMPVAFVAPLSSLFCIPILITLLLLAEL